LFLILCGGVRWGGGGGVGVGGGGGGGRGRGWEGSGIAVFTPELCRHLFLLDSNEDGLM